MFSIRAGVNGRSCGSVLGKDEERIMLQQMQAMAQKQVLLSFHSQIPYVPSKAFPFSCQNDRAACNACRRF